MGEATRVLASYLYDCSQTVPTLHSPNCLFNLFFCEILCPERQNYLKNLRFLFFFVLRKKHSGIKYFGKIFIFGRYISLTQGGHASQEADRVSIPRRAWCSKSHTLA